ncbi:putative tRNA-splicing endonuclease subunit Sen2 [Biscogniauxia mediterranea]|nr:putative tRNA-splicing endonuclease subunit Sen2 [Biscogniauxia mediterranea]
MADTINSSKSSLPQHDAAAAAAAAVNATTATARPEVKQGAPKAAPKGRSLNQTYALPTPIRTYPLPSFYPSNPLSLFHVVYTWVSQLVWPPPLEPSVVHVGTWSRETRSVHVHDPKSVRALWEQGFFGKGVYSRSEPNWLKREQVRKGNRDAHVAENFTVQRREERKQMKWDRARREHEAILRTRMEEAWIAPVGPAELLALPNSQQDLQLRLLNGFANGGVAPGTAAAATARVNPPSASNGKPVENGSRPRTPSNDAVTSPQKSTPPPPSEPNGTTPKRRKSVRFSPNVESTTFGLSDPPSPSHGLQLNGKASSLNGVILNGNSPLANGSSLSPSPSPARSSSEDTASQTDSEPTDEIVDIEHLQLTLEETFYLVFALGVLAVVDPATGRTMSAEDLFTLFRQTSYFPPRTVDLQPDDSFLLHYVVYHHFRSLGWVVRPGIKFGVDWLLYNRGPVFAHAEFALIVLPAYTADEWKAAGRQPPRRSWHWLHAINRVQATALKTLVLVYVDVPPPSEEPLDTVTMLRRYKVREFIVKRWLSNRNRG